MLVDDQKSTSSPIPSIRRYIIRGSRTLSNYWWALVTFFGGAGFFLTGLASYFQRSLFSEQTIAFFPQGLVMSFYGALGICFGLYLWFTLFGVSGAALTNLISKRAKFVFSAGASPAKTAASTCAIPSLMCNRFASISKKALAQNGLFIWL